MLDSTLTKAAERTGASTHAGASVTKATSVSATWRSYGRGGKSAATAINVGIGRAICRTSAGIAIGEAHAAIVHRTSNIVAAPKRRPILSGSEIAPFTGRPVEETRAMRDINIVVEEYLPAAPVEAPGTPTPAISAEKPETNPRTEVKRRSIPGIKNVPRVHRQRRSVNGPWIVNRQVANIGFRGLDGDRRALCGHRLLRRALQSSGVLGTLAHDLNCVEHILLLIEISVADC